MTQKLPYDHPVNMTLLGSWYARFVPIPVFDLLSQIVRSRLDLVCGRCSKPTV